MSSNRKLLPFIKEWSLHWQPALPEVQTLWPTVINESHYVDGFWVSNNFEMLAVLMILEGDAVLTYDDRQYLIREGEMAIIPFGYRKLMTGPSGKCVKRTIGLQGLALKMFVKIFHLDGLRIISQFDKKKFNGYFSRLAGLLKQKDPASAGRITLLVHSLLLDLQDKRPPEDLPHPLQMAIHYFEQNLAGKIHISQLAGLTKCSAKSLENLFKKHLGLSPLAYLKKMRLDYACILLESQVVSIKEIAHLCGYANQLYFSNDFRAKTGCSPSCYRAAHKKKFYRANH